MEMNDNFMFISQKVESESKLSQHNLDTPKLSSHFLPLTSTGTIIKSDDSSINSESHQIETTTLPPLHTVIEGNSVAESSIIPKDGTTPSPIHIHPISSSSSEDLKSTKSTKKLFSNYSPAQQSRIRKQLHQTLVNLAGGEEDIPSLLMSYFTSNIDGKKIYSKLEPPQNRLHKYEKLIPNIKHLMEKDPTRKKLFILLLRKSNFTKSEVEDQLGINCSNDLWKKVGQEDGLTDGEHEEHARRKRRKIEDSSTPSLNQFSEPSSFETSLSVSHINNTDYNIQLGNDSLLDINVHSEANHLTETIHSETQSSRTDTL